MRRTHSDRELFTYSLLQPYNFFFSYTLFRAGNAHATKVANNFIFDVIWEFHRGWNKKNVENCRHLLKIFLDNIEMYFN